MSTSHVQVLPPTAMATTVSRRSKHNQWVVAMANKLTTETTEGKPTENRHAVDNNRGGKRAVRPVGRGVPHAYAGGADGEGRGCR